MVKINEVKTKRVVGRPIKKGQVLNPKGRPPLPPEAREVRKMTTEEIIIIGTKLLDMSPNDLKKLIGDKDKPSKEVALASILYKSILAGDHQRLEAIFNRVIGKVKDVLQLSGHVGVGVGELEGLTLDEIRARRKELETERNNILNGKSKKKLPSKARGKRTATKTGTGQGA